MKFPALTLSAIVLALPLATISASASAQHAHDDHGARPATIELDAGKRWMTDASLRQGMSVMRGQIATALPAAHGGKMTAMQYADLGRNLGAQVAYIVENCKLAPKADAQLHVVIADLVQAIDAIDGKQAGADRASGIVQAAQALNTYGKYFDHPGWTPIRIPHG